MRGLVTMGIVWSLGCGGTPAPPPDPAPREEVPPPQLDGLPVYDAPENALPERVARVWAALQEQASVPYPSPSVTLSEYNHWVRDVFAEWVRRRLAALRRLEADFLSLSSGRALDQLFGSVAYATLYGSIATQIREIPTPPTIANDESLVAVFQRELDARASFVERRAEPALERCTQVAAAAPAPFQPWASVCRERAAALAPPPEPEPEPPAPLPALCEGDLGWSRIDGPPPNENARVEMAVVLEEGLLEGAPRRRLIAALRARLRSLGHRVVAPREVAQAEALRAEGRAAPRGPVCGQPPSLASILAKRHPHLVIASAYVRCLSPPNCRLSVTFRKVGTVSREGLPDRLGAETAYDAREDPAALVAAARALESDPEAYVLGGIEGSFESAAGRVFRVLGHQDEDPLLRVAPTLYSLKPRLQACQRGTEASVYSLAWSISPAGAVSEITVEGELLAPNTRDCITEVLQQSAWPCTQDGTPARVEATLCMRAAQARR
ncbi:MAG: hypothetical protein AAGE52_09600 [Myxococcota bacterium]